MSEISDPEGWSEEEWALEDAMLPIADDIARFEHIEDPVVVEMFNRARATDEMIRMTQRALAEMEEVRAMTLKGLEAWEEES